MSGVANLPQRDGKTRVVIVGAGFAGIQLAKTLSSKHFQVILLDRNNYHQFQPLFYQVATSGLEPSSISFPIRKIFQDKKNVHFRVASLEKIDPEGRLIQTDIGEIEYDDLVLAIGANTNFFGNRNIEKYAVPMKSVSEALYLRNTILDNYENALNTEDVERQKSLLNIVITGGGPTGVELAGALAEMRTYVLPKDYPDIDFSRMQITLLEGSPRLLNGMSEHAGKQALKYLEQLGVEVQLSTLVEDYDGTSVVLKNGEQLKTKTLLWAAGIRANDAYGLPNTAFGPGNRVLVNAYSQTLFNENVYVVGDQSLMVTEEKEKGDPQVAQVAIQQATRLAKNLAAKREGKPRVPFKYNDKGSMATIGRNLAVADLPVMKLKGYIAWLLWLFVHLMAILGAKNKLFVFINWMWSYLTYDQSLRLMIKPKIPNVDRD